jgi:hypothetical protein
MLARYEGHSLMNRKTTACLDLYVMKEAAGPCETSVDTIRNSPRNTESDPRRGLASNTPTQQSKFRVADKDRRRTQC